MTLDELKHLKKTVEWLVENGTESSFCLAVDCSSIQCKALRILNREIELKTMDPRKQRLDIIDAQGNLITGP